MKPAVHSAARRCSTSGSMICRLRTACGDLYPSESSHTLENRVPVQNLPDDRLFSKTSLGGVLVIVLDQPPCLAWLLR